MRSTTIPFMYIKQNRDERLHVKGIAVTMEEWVGYGDKRNK